MTLYVPTSVASVTMHAAGDVVDLLDHTHAPGDRPDLDSADGWAIACSSVCERAIVDGFDAWADGDAIEGDGRVDVYGVTVPADEVEDDAPAEPAVPVFNITVNTPKQKRQKRTKVTVEPANVTVTPQITVEQPPQQTRRTTVHRRKDGTMIVESEPNP